MFDFITALGGLYQAYGENEAGKFKNRVEKYNAGINELQAKDAIYRGGMDANRVASTVRKTIGSQRASAAAGGTVVDTGSNAGLITDSERAGRADMDTIRNNAMREAWGFRTQATSHRVQGIIDRMTGEQQATGTLLTTGAKAYDSAGSYAAMGA